MSDNAIPPGPNEPTPPVPPVPPVPTPPAPGDETPPEQVMPQADGRGGSGITADDTPTDPAPVLPSEPA